VTSPSRTSKPREPPHLDAGSDLQEVLPLHDAGVTAGIADSAIARNFAETVNW